MTNWLTLERCSSCGRSWHMIWIVWQNFRSIHSISTNWVNHRSQVLLIYEVLCCTRWALHGVFNAVWGTILVNGSQIWVVVLDTDTSSVDRRAADISLCHVFSLQVLQLFRLVKELKRFIDWPIGWGVWIAALVVYASYLRLSLAKRIAWVVATCLYLGCCTLVWHSLPQLHRKVISKVTFLQSGGSLNNALIQRWSFLWCHGMALSEYVTIVMVHSIVSGSWDSTTCLLEVLEDIGLLICRWCNGSPQIVHHLNLSLKLKFLNQNA